MQYIVLHNTMDNIKAYRANKKSGGKNSCHSNYLGRVKRKTPIRETLSAESEEERHSDHPQCIQSQYNTQF